jgi:hypothetical protein
LRILIAS